MKIVDLSWNEVISRRSNHPLLPKSIRGLTVGKLGCGKTTLLLNLLLRPEWLDYDNLCVFGKSLFQPEYRILKRTFEENLPERVYFEIVRDEGSKYHHRLLYKNGLNRLETTTTRT